VSSPLKLFQLEEPEGSPLESDGPGAAVGIDLAGAVAFSLGGNAEILGGRDGALWSEPTAPATLLAQLKMRAEQALARPVTHAVVTGDRLDPTAIEEAAASIGMTVMRLMTRAEAASLASIADAKQAAVLGAAIAAEDMAAALLPPSSL